MLSADGKGKVDTAMTDDLKSVGARGALPTAFVEEMKELFGKLPGVSVSELPAFLESLQGERSCGLRRNPLKYTAEEFEEGMPFSLERVPWAEEGYFYRKEEQPGKSSLHEAGAFYMQEPSAMIAAELLDARPGECIADLCAAPGGKSTQIAGKMQGKGLLVCNEYVPARAQVLAQNIERMGIRNCVILQESADRIAGRFPLFFDRVLVDAPCSGEGMFRKEEQALLQWSPENVGMCAQRQREILEEAAKILKPGGVLVYSTCTFSEAEDEAVIRNFLREHEEFSADDTILSEELVRAGVCPGGLPGTVRMWPHKLCGEGHFVARLIRRSKEDYWGKEVNKREEEFSEKKRNKSKKAYSGKKANKNEVFYPEKKPRRRDRSAGELAGNRKPRERGSEQEKQNLFEAFCRQYLEEEYLHKLEESGKFVWKKEHLFHVPGELPELGGLRVVRAGLHLGEAKKGRFEPSHTWAMTLGKEDVRQSMETGNPAAYLRGETEENRGYQGWTLMLQRGRALGWGKAGGNTVKNHYPKGLRKF